ncbi:AMP-binding protein [Cellulophaga sp. Hel_I_12]|uniref:AMP-binding protein n=1 Tax=Cellulophaga sp. Hel_I_12 TaxID=1249972 RepID=UPI0006478AB6|nr:AMP-binding protein [Cellulophaga sp. Hel_I_12]
MITSKNIHLAFKLNGISFSFDDLKEVAYSLIKEGEDFEVAIGNFLIDWIDDSDVIEVSTSGSTGVPQKIKLKKQHMVNSAMATGEYFGLKPTNTALLCLPATYIAGKMMLVRAMVLGLHLECVQPNSNPVQKIKAVYDFGAMIPLQLENSLSKMKHFRTLIIGGSPLSNRLISQIQTKKTMVYETYGMTETISHIAVKKVNHAIKKTTYFEALPNIKLKIDDRNCLVIHAPEIAEKEVITNDVVNLISASQFEWLGRFDSIINSGGVKLNPETIEAKLNEVLKQSFFVAGIPDPVLGEKLVLILEGSVDVLAIQTTVAQLKSLTKFEIPKEIFCLEKFIRTENGKLQRTKTLSLALK